MPGRKALDKKALWQDIARNERRKQRENLAGLRRRLKEARAARKDALAEAKSSCRQGRLQARQRVKELRARVLTELRELGHREREEARSACKAGKAAARALGDDVGRRRGELEAERAYRKDLRRLEHANKERHRERITARERAGESDDEVRANIPPELLPLFERVKRQIKGSERMSRTEAFLHYAEEHPHEVLEVIEDRTEEVIRELEAEERRARSKLRRPVPRRRFTPEELAETPF